MTKGKYLLSNLKFIRGYYNQGQKELAKLLHITQGTYSEYENGVKNIPDDIVQVLAFHYRTTVYALNNFDYSQSPELLIPPTKEMTLKSSWVILPVFTDETAQNNPDFRKAYETLDFWMKKMLEKKDILSDEKQVRKMGLDVEMCEKLFRKAWSEDKIYMAAANVIRFYYLEISTMFSGNDEYFSFVFDEKRSNLDIKSKYLRETPNRQEIAKLKKQRTEMYERTYQEVFSIIAEMKKDVRYVEVADYLLAVQYMVGYYDNRWSLNTNVEFGYGLMEGLAKLGNVYAKAIVE